MKTSARCSEGSWHTLTSVGVPVSRASCALMTMHPELVWRTVQWTEGQAVTLRDQPRSRLQDAFYTASPVAVVRRTRRAVRVPLLENAPGGFTDVHLAVLHAIAQPLARRRLASAHFTKRALLEVYLGKNAARRVPAGEVQRGRGEQIDARQPPLRHGRAGRKAAPTHHEH